ncbi:MAG: cupin domain-containing protein [Desulfobacterales bacterium]|nr:cupin domain-containing protein [Deltaproteobacteria bacterium]NNK93276.1 cupin domain-containing protein [Desulfobacterales bacterium]
MNTNKTLWVLGHKVTYVETIGDYSLLEVSVTPNVPGPPPHYHVDSPELFHLIDGELDVMLDGSWCSLKKGESIMVPKNSVHSFRSNGTNECRFITTWSPRGFEGFFLEFGVPINNENAFEKSVSDEMIQKVVTGCSKYGMIVVDDA